MTLKAIHDYFQKRKMAGLVVTDRKKHRVVFKVEEKNLLALPLEMEQFRQQGVDFIFKKLTLIDRIKLRKNCFRMELR